MLNLSFWKTWPRPERLILIIPALLFALALCGQAYTYFTSPSPVIGFQTIEESHLNEIPVDRFQKGIFGFAIAGNNYSVTQRFLGTPLTPNTSATYIYLFIFSICVVGLLAIITTLSRFYYLMGMGLFIVLMVSLRMETLLVFGLADKTFTIFLLIAYGAVSFYFYYFDQALSFIYRAGIFLLITIVSACIIYFFAETPAPFLFLSVFSIPAGIIGTGIFILMVSHEILAGFLFAVTQGTRPTKSLNHFLIVTIVYMLNLVLVYCVRFRYLKWDIIQINLFLLLTISGILGIWGIRQRQKQFEGILNTDPYGVYGFLLLGSVCFSTIALFFGTANDPGTSAIGDLIIFSHLGFGLIFIFYIINNFLSMLARNYQVYKVMYNPNNMPFFTFRLAGVITTLALVIFNTWQVPAHNAMSSFYNANADLYTTLNDPAVAKLLYEQGRTYGFSNHHSNYALANIEGIRMNTARERTYYESAAYARPTEMAYLNWAQTFQTEEKPFEAILVLQEGLKKFPGSGPLMNTMGLLYDELNRQDSSAYYLNNVQNSEAPQVNLLSLAARKRLSLEGSPVISPGDGAGLKANFLAWENSLQIMDSTTFIMPTDTVLTLSQAVLICNHLINEPGSDTVIVRRSVELARKPDNDGFREAILFASALSWYAGGEVQRAFQLLEEVAITSSNKGKYNNILASWCIEQEEAERARGYIEYALQQNYPPASITNAVVLTEAVRVEGPLAKWNAGDAIRSWDSLQNRTDTLVASLASRSINILTVPASDVNTLSDEDKYAYCRYRLAASDSLAFSSIVESMESHDQKALSYLERSQRLAALDAWPAAVYTFQKIRGLELSDPTLHEKIRLQELLLLAHRNDLDAIRNILKSSGLVLNGKLTSYRVYFEGLLSEQDGDTTTAAKKFRWLSGSNPFFEDGVITAARFFRTHGSDRSLSYNMLVTALQHHPSSIRLRKAYVQEAYRSGLRNFGDSALTDLKGMITDEAYRTFLKENESVMAPPVY